MSGLMLEPKVSSSYRAARVDHRDPYCLIELLDAEAGFAVARSGSAAAADDATVMLLRARHANEAIRLAGGLEVAARLVLVCEAFEARQLRGLIAAGFRGAVLRSDAARTLIPTIDAVAAGQICFPLADAAEVERPVLSIREKQVIGLVTLGLANSEIAERLFIAECTVKSHLTAAFAKLGVRSRHEAVDRIVDPTSGLGLGILALDPEPLDGVRHEARLPH
ncbi:MAG: response regulator transcription factor [Solirubrobacteraceae bacterium]